MSTVRPSKAETWRVYRRFVNDLQAVFLLAGTPLDNAIAAQLREGASGHSPGVLCSTAVGEWIISMSSPQQESPRKWSHAWVYTRFDKPDLAYATAGLSDVNRYSGKWNHVLEMAERSDWLIAQIQSFQPRVMRVEEHPRFTSQLGREHRISVM